MKCVVCRGANQCKVRHDRQSSAHGMPRRLLCMALGVLSRTQKAMDEVRMPALTTGQVSVHLLVLMLDGLLVMHPVPLRTVAAASHTLDLLPCCDLDLVPEHFKALANPKPGNLAPQTCHLCVHHPMYTVL